MTYELRFDPEAIKVIQKFPKTVRRRIFRKLQDSKEPPHHYFERLTNHLEYKLRIGNYRVIASITTTTIHVLHVGHRRNIYK